MEQYYTEIKRIEKRFVRSSTNYQINRKGPLILGLLSCLMYFNFSQHNYNLGMKSEFMPRPQSKRVENTVRPVTRYVNTEQAKSTFEQGKAEQSKQHYQKAIELYIRATVYDANFFQAYCNMGSCYRALRQYKDSKRSYLKAISIKHDDAISHYNLANVLRLMGDFQSSIEHYTFVINLKEQQEKEIGSLYVNSLVNLGICYKNKNLFDKACEFYEKARKVDPNDETCLFNYAMALVGSLGEIDQEVFQEVAKQKAEKASIIMNKYNEINQGNQMISFQLVRMSIIIDKSTPNIDKAMIDLNQMLKQPSCTLTDEINSEIGYCLKLLKKYEASAKQYRKTLTDFNKNKPAPQTQNVYDSTGDGATVQTTRPDITEEEGIRMIEEGRYQQVQARINQLQEKSSLRHTLQMALELSLVQQSEAHLKKAESIYQTHFKPKGKDIDMNSLTIETHKAIGQLLALQGNFKESIKHYEFVTSKLSSEQEKSKIHSFLGNDYEAMGEISKALDEYKTALASQPDSYELNYNLGCCLYEEVQYQGAKKCFQRALELIDKDSSLKLEKKQLYNADCLIALASCIGELEVNKAKAYSIYYRAWALLQEVISSTEEQLGIEQKRIMKFYLQWADILEEKMNQADSRRSEEYIKSKETLLEVYVSLLEMKQCPDRDAILNNAATIFYEDKLYVNALANFNQIQSEEAISSNNLALTYLHLNEHYMASQQIFKVAASSDSLDPIEIFNKSMINWIYGLPEQNQALAQQFHNSSDQAMVYRLEYAKIVSDALTHQINDLEEPYEHSELTNILNKATNSEFLRSFVEEAERPKLKALTMTLKQNRPKSKDNVDPNLLALALNPSANPEEELNQIIQRCTSSPEMSQGAVELLINLFIFRNRDHLPSIRGVLKKWSVNKTQSIDLNLDRRVTVTPSMTACTFGQAARVQSIDDLLAHLLSCQGQLEGKLVTLLKVIERCYYKSNYRKPMEYDYTFPKHAFWKEDNITFLKIANIVLNVCPVQQFSLSGSTLLEMKNSIFDDLQQALVKHAKKESNFEMSLHKVPAITIYGFLHSKQDCLLFLRELQKDSSDKKVIDIGKDTQELHVTISVILKVVCQWQQPNANLNLIRSLWEHPLAIEAQSVISLESDLQLLKASSDKCRELIEAIPILKKV